MDEEMNVSELLVEQTKENQTKTILLMIEELERETKDENRKEVLADVRERIKTLLFQSTCLCEARPSQTGVLLPLVCGAIIT